MLEKEALIGFSVNPELVPIYNRMTGAEKGSLESLSVDLCGTSANVARAINVLGGKSKVLAFTGVKNDFESHTLRWALEKYEIPHREFQILDHSHISLFPIDGLPKNKVFGLKGNIEESKINETINQIGEEEGMYRIATGVREEELPFVKALFNKHIGYRSLNPRIALIEKRNSFIEILKQTDLLIMNDAEYDACRVTGISELHQYGPKVIIVTREKDGGMFSKEGETPEMFEACKKYLGKEVYTIGAGDWFHAAFIIKTMEFGKDFSSLTIEEIRECILFATQVSGKKVTMQGAANGPSKNDL